MAELLEALQVGAQDYHVKPGLEIDGLTHSNLQGIETPQVMNDLKGIKQMFSNSEALLYQIVHANAEGVLVVNQDSKVLFVNPAAEALLQQSSADLLGKPFRIPIIVDEIIEKEIVMTEGVKEAVEARVVPSDWEGEQVFLIFLRPISERKRLEKALRESEIRFQSMFNAGTDAILITDSLLNILYSNNAASGTFGFDETELRGMAISSLIPDDLIESQIQDQLPFQGNEDNLAFREKLETMGRRKSGDGFQLELVCIPWVVDEKKYFGLVLRDMAHIQKEQESVQLHDRLAAVGQLAAGIAHDFNNILGTIILYSESLLKKQELSPENNERMTMIFNQARRGAMLTSQILDFSRRSVIEPRPIELVKFLREIEKLLASTISTSIQIKTIAQEEQLVICADATRLQQIFVNLALNAKDAMPAGGYLGFELSRIQVLPNSHWPHRDMPPGEWIKIEVSDNGVGIPADTQNHIFEPFFTTKGPGKGTGLGLAQVYGIVKQHHGYIDIDSEVGSGTTFTMYFPAEVGSVVEEIAQEQTVPNSANGETLLVVEDDLASRRSICDILESLNYTVLPAANGQEALDVYDQRNGAVDLILSDLVMPDMDGRQLYSILSREHPDAKLILMTGYPLGNGTRELLDQHKMSWLQKPMTTEILAGAVRTMLDQVG